MKPMTALAALAMAGDSVMIDSYVYNKPVVGIKKKHRYNGKQKQKAKAIRVEKRRAANKRAKKSKARNR
jgi:hypothetical protein